MKALYRVCPNIGDLKDGEVFRFRSGKPGVYKFINGAGSPCTMEESGQGAWVATLTQEPQQMLRDDALVEVVYVP